MSFIMSPSCQCHSSSIHIPDLICKDFKNKVFVFKYSNSCPPSHIVVSPFLWKKWRGGGNWPEGVYVKEKNQLHEILTQTVDEILCEYVNIS